MDEFPIACFYWVWIWQFCLGHRNTDALPETEAKNSNVLTDSLVIKTRALKSFMGKLKQLLMA